MWATVRTYERAEEFWVGEHATAYVLSDEDMFLLKAASGDDLGSERWRDVEDMQLYVQRGPKYEPILEEIEKQHPFNSGPMEAWHIRDRSHPLFAIEAAAQMLPGLPVPLTKCALELATEFKAEYSVLGVTGDGRREVSSIRSFVLLNVWSFSGGDERAVTDVITRPFDKRAIERDGDTLHLKTTESNSGAK